MKKSFQIFIDSLCVLDDLTLEEKGQLFDAIYRYQIGNEVELKGIVKVAFSPMRAQFERDNEKYKLVCDRNQKIAKERWDTKSTTRTKSIPKVRSHADTDTDTDTNKIVEVVKDLNKTLGTKYRADTLSTTSAINARFAEGYTVDDFKTVHKIKFDEWNGTDMAKHLTPATLYRPGNFEKYLNQIPKEQEQAGGVTW